MVRISRLIATAAMVAGGTFAAVASVGAQSATSATKPFSLGFSGGASIPVSDLSNGVNTGYNIGAHVGLAAPAIPISFRGDVEYNSWGNKLGGGNSHMNAFIGNAVFSIPTASVVRPYLIGGIGAYNTTSQTNLGFNGGAGLTIPLSGFNAFVEARYHHVNGNGASLAFVPITFGVMF